MSMAKDRAQRVRAKSALNGLVTMFTPRIMVIKMSKMAHFFLTTIKNQSQFGENI